MKPLKMPEKFSTQLKPDRFVLGLLVILMLCYQNSNAGEVKTVIEQSDTAMTYRNKLYHFSFIIPAGWEKQSGNVNSDNALFMQMPLSQSCSFQFNVTPMPLNFPVETVVSNGLGTARRQVRANKLLSAKRRDEVSIEKVQEKGKTVEKTITLVRGWQIVETPKPQTLQRIVYQGYDRENHYFNFIAAATSENFANCSPQLQQIIDSISFKLF